MTNPEHISPTKEIIVIEDSDDDVEVLKKALDRAGIANPMRFFRDGSCALDHLNEAQGSLVSGVIPAVLLIDLKLPNKNGFEILQWLGQHPAYDKTLKIVISAMEDLRDINKAYRLGAHSFILKPVGQSDIQGIINGFHGYWVYAGEIQQA